MSLLSLIIWSPDPAIFTIPLSGIGLEDRPVVWYGLLFATGFLLSQQVMYYIFKKEGKPQEDVDKLTTYMVVAVVLGARLGHCLFYNPSFYLSNPLEILKIWEGGLASHGGAIGILTAIWIFVRRIEGYRWLWMLDRLAIVACLTGALIRTGNLMNSEMEGTATNSSYGIVYARGTEDILDFDEEQVESVSFEEGGTMTSDIPGRFPIKAIVEFKRDVKFETAQQINFIENTLRRNLLGYTEVVEHIDFGKGQPLSYQLIERGGRQYLEISGIGIPRHPAQLYEALACVLIMSLVFWLWKNKRDQLPEGFMFAVFMMLLWSLRFVDEFFKMNQEAFEEGLPINMGQILSIPGFLMGVAAMIYALRNKKTSNSESE